MSRHRHHHQQQAQGMRGESPLQSMREAAADALVVPMRVALPDAPASGEEIAEQIVETLSREHRCAREIVYQDGLIWRCACGASGPTGRSHDGIPFVNAEILAHAPGETRS